MRIKSAGLLWQGLLIVLCSLIAFGQTTKFEVTLSPQLGTLPKDGRLFVILGKSERPEPRLVAAQAGSDSSPMFARDVTGLSALHAGTIDASCLAFPVRSLNDVKPGTYFVQAVLDTNPDIRHLNAPGNLYSRPVKLEFDPAKGATIKLQLALQLPADQVPPETEHLKFVKLKSERLSKFWGRPIYLRAGIILPRDFAKEPGRRYPVRIHIGGYGDRYSNVRRMMDNRSDFQKMWMADGTAQIIFIHLDGAGPLGDPYQVNSANHGPYGDAVTQELIPFIEKAYRGIGEGSARVLDGGSTGGWVALALQLFYPDYFNGVWSFCSDPVDFRAFQLVNIYSDANAFINRHGFERPSAREVSGDVKYTMRHEVQMENVLGRGDSWALSGKPWGAWNATYGPRGTDGNPIPLWDPQTGVINRAVVEHWKQYDLRLYIEQNWAKLAPKLNGKLHIWMGDADDFFLNNAMRMLSESLKNVSPPFVGDIQFSPGQGHCWIGLSESQLMSQMAATMKKPE